MEVPHHWRLKKQRYAMTGTSCILCGAPSLANKAVCPKCGSGKVQAEPSAIGYNVLQPVMESVPVTRNR